jgi:transcriptional regulator with XRE-family HTH domain
MTQEEILKARQIKAARALLDWSQEDLAKKTRLSIATIRQLELGHISPRGKTNLLIRHAFENAGLEFIEPNGVRQQPEGIAVYQGTRGIREFFDDVYETSLKTGKEIVQVWASPKPFIKLIGDYRETHAQRMVAATDHIAVRSILTEDCDNIPPTSTYSEYKFLSRHFVDSVPFYVYGDKYAIIPFSEDEEAKVIVIHSRAAADSFRRQFNSMWEKATPIDCPGGNKKLKAEKRSRKE